MIRHEDVHYGEPFVWFECEKDGHVYSYNFIEEFIHRNDTQKQLDTMNDWIVKFLPRVVSSQ